MRAYVRENLKEIITITVLLVCALTLINANVLLAKISPVASEELTLDMCDMKEDIYNYTGEEIKPEIRRLIFDDNEGNKVIKYADEIIIREYVNNVEIGNASIKVSLDGYQGTILVENAFRIQPAKVTNLQIVQATREYVDLSWDRTVGAEGYLVYKSIDNGKSYVTVGEISDGDVTTYQDTDIQFNASFLYYVRACMYQDEQPVYGWASEKVRQLTPLATPVLTSATNKAYNSIELQWEVVDGAVGYQVYRSLTKDGTYDCIAELTDGTVTTYTDVTCECGIDYYYYIKACQAIDTQKVYGEASQIVSAKTTPNRVGISGNGNETQVNLSWKQSTGAQGYEVYRSIDSTSSYEMVAKIEKNDTLNWSESGLDKHTAYYYRIRPYCVVNGTTVYGSYSGTYEKEAVIEYNYSSATGVDVLRQYAGKVSYVYGGNTVKGWDCSGFTQRTFKTHFGISLGRTSGEQASGGKTVSKNDRSSWQPGDLLFYTENGRISHVAVYLGNGQMIHALSEKYDTLIQNVDYYETWDKKTTLYKVKRYF